MIYNILVTLLCIKFGITHVLLFIFLNVRKDFVESWAISNEKHLKLVILGFKIDDTLI